MKKLNFLLLALLSLAFVACDPDKTDTKINNNEDVSAEELVGKWYIGQNPEVWTSVLVSMELESAGIINFNADGTFSQRLEYEKMEGKYTYDNGILSTVNECGSYYDFQVRDWVDIPDSELVKVPVKYSPKFLYGNNIMIQEMIIERNPQQGPAKEDAAAILFKEGTTVPSDKSLLQGFWNWNAFGIPNTTRLAFKFDGNNFTMWNNSYNERTTGTYEYKSGMVKFNVDSASYKIRRFEDLPDGFNPDTIPNLEREWQTPDRSKFDRMIPTFGWEFVMPFIPDGNVMYSNYANLSCVLEKMNLQLQ